MVYTICVILHTAASIFYCGGAVVQKKNIIFSAICLIIFTAFCVLMINAVLNMEVKTSSVNVKYLPTIVIDAGHGGEDGGTVSADGTLEKDVNLAISNDIYDLLCFLGFDVIRTRDKDISLNTSESTIRARKVADMKKRLEIYNSSDKNVIISIHQNQFSESKYHGTQLFYSPNKPESKQLADKIKWSVKKQIQPDNERESKQSDNGIYLLKNAQNPAVIVECGFLSNPDECQKLISDEYQKQISYAIVTGFLDYYNTN